MLSKATHSIHVLAAIAAITICTGVHTLTPKTYAQNQVSVTKHDVSAKQALWVVGDSYGVGISGDGRYLNSKAVQGKTIPQITKQLYEVPKGSALIVCGGTNDANGNYSDNGLRENAKNLIRIAKERDLRIVVWIGPTTVDSKRNARLSVNLISADRTLNSVMQENGITYLSLHKPPYNQFYKQDGLHYGPKGFSKVRESVRNIP